MTVVEVNVYDITKTVIEIYAKLCDKKHKKTV